MKHEFVVQSEQVRGERRAHWVICLPCGYQCPVIDSHEIDNNFTGSRAEKRAEAFLDLIEDTK